MSSLTHAIGGIFQPLLRAVADVLAWLYSIVPIYPVDVALLTIIIMAVLTPLTVKSTKNMAAMQALGPEMKKLQQKYKGAENRALLNEEMMKLYKEHKVNPASGCLPMLLQMPAFLILYDVIRGITNTVNRGQLLVSGHKCVPLAGANVCAAPRYISNSTKMFSQIVAAHGQLNSFGMDFAQKLLAHHSPVFAYLPYLLLVLGSVGLQYLQMSRLNARNPQAAQSNPQAAMMQKYMPIIFGLIYLNVAALLNVYFVMSSAIRILTQEVLFRRGIVAGPPIPGGKGLPAKGTGSSADRIERQIPKARPPLSSKARPDSGTVPATKSTKSTTVRARTAKAESDPVVNANHVQPTSGSREVTSEGEPQKDVGSRRPSNGQRSPSQSNARSGSSTRSALENGRARDGRAGPTSQGRRSRSTSSEGARPNGTAKAPAVEESEKPPREHPRSKAKRERKAR